MEIEPELGELTEQLRQRCPAAWERFYRLTHLPILRQLRRLTGDATRAEEVLQMAFVTALERIDHFDPARGTADGWLAGIARMKSLEAARARRRSVSLPENLDVPEPDEESDADEEMVALVLDRLEPRYAEVLRRKYLNDQSMETIAQELGIKPATVGTLLHRGRQQFRDVHAELAAGPRRNGSHPQCAVLPRA